MKATIKNILYACERLLQQNNYKDDSIPKGLVSCDGDVEVSYKDHYETFPSVKEAIASMRAAVEDKLGEKFEDFSGTDYFDFIQEGRVDKTLDLPIGIILNSEDEVLICSHLAIPYHPEVEGLGIFAYDKSRVESFPGIHVAVHGCSDVANLRSVA